VRKSLILLLSLLTGCFSYGPVGSVPVAPGTAVRARLNAPTDIRLTNVSVNNAVQVNGEVVSEERDTLGLSVFSLRALGGLEFPAAGETVRIARARIAGLERRRVDLLRSAALVGAVAAVASLAFSAFSTGSSSGGGGPTPIPQ
jgi:hypothetical protein